MFTWTKHAEIIFNLIGQGINLIAQGFCEWALVDPALSSGSLWSSEGHLWAYTSNWAPVGGGPQSKGPVCGTGALRAALAH